MIETRKVICSVLIETFEDTTKSLLKNLRTVASVDCTDEVQLLHLLVQKRPTCRLSLALSLKNSNGLSDVDPTHQRESVVYALPPPL